MAPQLDYVCDGCGACCLHLAIPVTAADAWQEQKIALQLTPQPTVLGVGFLGSPARDGCPLLTSAGQCEVYAARPHCCKVLAAGSPLCQYARGRAGLRPLMPQGF